MKKIHKIMFSLILLILITISCYNARGGCYEESNRFSSGYCEFMTILLYSRVPSDEISIDTKSRILIICAKQERDRKTCDNRTEWWPLPKNFNHPSGNENILSTSPENKNE